MNRYSPELLFILPNLLLITGKTSKKRQNQPWKSISSRRTTWCSYSSSCTPTTGFLTRVTTTTASPLSGLLTSTKSETCWRCARSTIWGPWARPWTTTPLITTSLVNSVKICFWIKYITLIDFYIGHVTTWLMAHKYDLQNVFEHILPFVIKHLDLIMAEDIWQHVVSNKDIVKIIISRQFDDNRNHKCPPKLKICTRVAP